MAMVQDPVCGMDVATDSAAAKEDYQGQTYYFCSTACQEKFAAAPQTYTRGPQPAFAATNGAAAAAVLTVGIGSFILGLLTTLAAASRPISTALAFYGPAGPLSGKSTVAVVVWLVAWAVFHKRWKNTQVNFSGSSLPHSSSSPWGCWEPSRRFSNGSAGNGLSALPTVSGAAEYPELAEG